MGNGPKGLLNALWVPSPFTYSNKSFRQTSCLFVLLEIEEGAQDSSKLIIFQYMYALQG